MEDQQHKQSLHFKGGRCVGNYDGRMLVASAASVYRVLPIPLQTQIKVFNKIKFILNKCPYWFSH